jgi:thymidylate kinase
MSYRGQTNSDLPGMLRRVWWYRVTNIHEDWSLQQYRCGSLRYPAVVISFKVLPRIHLERKTARKNSRSTARIEQNTRTLGKPRRCDAHF